MTEMAPSEQSPASQALVRASAVERRIFLLRGERVILDADLASFYGVPTERLNEQVKRNRARFPERLCLPPDPQGGRLDRSQNATGALRRRDLRFLPYGFTEHGVIMAANVLKSSIAIEASIQVLALRLRSRIVTLERATHLDPQQRPVFPAPSLSG